MKDPPNRRPDGSPGQNGPKNLYHGLSGGKTIIIQGRDDTGNCQDKSSRPFQYPRGQNGRTSNNT